MGNALKDLGKLDEAIQAYNKALAIKPDYAEAFNNMGNALKEQGKLDEAIEAYNKAISIKPDYAEAYNNATELLKIYSPKGQISQSLFTIDNKIKNLSPGILNATSDREIIDNLLEGLSYIAEDTFEYKTPLSQIYKRNTVDLNCKRHLKIFTTQDIIPEFCFGCFKVQVEVATVIDLVKLASLFYKFDFEEDLTKKTIIELRPNVPGFYKGLIYCNGLDQAQRVKTLLDTLLKEIFDEETISKLKRGCSEYPLKFPSYGEIPKNSKTIMSFPEEWRQLEKKCDQDELIEPDDTTIASLPEFCLSDFYIIQKWIDYAKGIGDQSIETFNDRRIIFKDIYEMAKTRAISPSLLS
jgi:tetratricopeptide (TPR) repeat protein